MLSHQIAERAPRIPADDLQLCVGPIGKHKRPDIREEQSQSIVIVRLQKVAEKDEFWCAVIVTRHGSRMADQRRYCLNAAFIDTAAMPKMVGFPLAQEQRGAELSGNPILAVADQAFLEPEQEPL